MDVYFLKYLNGVVGWCWSRRLREWSLCLLYWRITVLAKPCLPLVDRRPLCIWSGYVSAQRGRHRDYKLSFGRWF